MVCSCTTRLNIQKLYIHFTDCIYVFVLIYFQRDATLHSLFIYGKLLYMFRVVSSPIIRSIYNCIYSIWYLLTITDVCLYCGRVGAGLSVVWELYRSVTYVTVPRHWFSHVISVTLCLQCEMWKHWACLCFAASLTTVLKRDHQISLMKSRFSGINITALL